ncbi:MAG TPA: DUF4097 family beta strand repeat-containing protein [Longimicrobiales bacterium]|nr:DUF4097 family beta strand repeat-containing protein [Longimicrobiales bacterium]
MFLGIVTGVLLLAAPAFQSGDTTFAVDPHGRLRIDNVRGDLRVRTWTRPAIRVTASREDIEALRIREGGPLVHLEGEQHGEQGDYEITIPATMALGITGASADVDVAGAGGEVSVETVHGDVNVSGGAGIVAVRTTQGDIRVEGARGRVEANAASGDIDMDDIEGDIEAETISGGITLQRIASSSVQASAVSGDVLYDGTIRDGGRYTLSTHSGDVTVGIPRNVNASLSVATFSGEFETDIPVQLTDTERGRRFTLTLGSGSARVNVESFSGDVRLKRPGFGPRSENP